MNKKLQMVGIGLLAVIAVIALARNMKRYSAGQDLLPMPMPPRFQLDLLAQEQAYPGKVIHAKLAGKEVVNYTCTEKDASIALFTMRDVKTNFNAFPHVQSAKDPEGLSYATRISGDKGVFILSVQSGFAKRPSSITATINQGGEGLLFQHEDIKFTKIAEPRRFLSAPSPDESAISERQVKFTLDDLKGGYNIDLVRQPSPNDLVIAHIIGTAFSAENPLADRVFSGDVLSTYYGHGNDAIRVRLDRYHFKNSNTTLTYRNAEIVQRNGHNYLWLPRLQTIGSILSYNAILSHFIELPKPGPTAKHPLSRADVIVKLMPAAKSQPRIEFDGVGIGLRLMSITPAPALMGLDTIRVMISSPPAVNVKGQPTVPINGVDQMIKVDHPAKPPQLSKIPELKLQVRISAPTKVSSDIVVLPIHHNNLRR